MEVRTLISDKVAKELLYYTGRKNLSESLDYIIEEWLALQKIKKLNTKIEKRPFEFSDNYSSETVRSLNRNR